MTGADDRPLSGESYCLTGNGLHGFKHPYPSLPRKKLSGNRPKRRGKSCSEAVRASRRALRARLGTRCIPDGKLCNGDPAGRAVRNLCRVLAQFADGARPGGGAAALAARRMTPAAGKLDRAEAACSCSTPSPPARPQPSASSSALASRRSGISVRRDPVSTAATRRLAAAFNI